MKKEAIATGRNVEEALDAACGQLGISRGVDDYEHEILDMPSKGFLGLGAKPARVRVWIEVPDAPAPKAAEKPEVRRAEPAKPAAFEPKPLAPVVKREEKKPVFEKPAEREAAPEKKEPAPVAAPSFRREREPDRPVDFGNKPQIAEEYVNGMIAAMGLSGVHADVRQDGQTLLVQISGDEAGVTIGRRGDTLDAIQYLTGLAVNRGEGDFARVVVDSGDYRDKRRRTLEQLAKKLANNAVRTGRPTTLEPMNPYERRIIHAAVAQVEGATSSSVGEEPNRSVVITSLNPRPPRDGDRPYEGRPRGRRDDRRGGRGGRDGRGRRPRPEPYHESGTREVAPSEAKDHTLYGKVEI